MRQTCFYSDWFSCKNCLWVTTLYRLYIIWRITNQLLWNGSAENAYIFMRFCRKLVSASHVNEPFACTVSENYLFSFEPSKLGLSPSIKLQAISSWSFHFSVMAIWHISMPSQEASKTTIATKQKAKRSSQPHTHDIQFSSCPYNLRQQGRIFLFRKCECTHKWKPL